MLGACLAFHPFGVGRLVPASGEMASSLYGHGVMSVGLPLAPFHSAHELSVVMRVLVISNKSR